MMYYKCNRTEVATAKRHGDKFCSAKMECGICNSWGVSPKILGWAGDYTKMSACQPTIVHSLECDRCKVRFTCWTEDDMPMNRSDE